MKALKYNDTGEEVMLLQKALNEVTGKELNADGHFGKLTEQALRYYQQRARLTVDGIYGDEVYSKLGPLIEKKYIRERDVEARAKVARLPVDIIKGFKEVEAKSSGFLNNGKCIILFERHKFYQYLAKKKGAGFADEVARSNPSICHPSRGGYLGYEKEWPRIERAASIDRESALMSASFGLFQIMGFNYAMCGYRDVESFYQAMCESESLQLDAVLSFINSYRQLKTAVRNRDIAKIAYFYNGPANATNNYVAKLTNAIKKYG